MATKSNRRMVNRRVTDGELVELLKTGAEPVFDAKKVAEELGITRPTALRRLQTLAEERGDIRTDTIGQADVFWWEGADEATSDDDRRDFLMESLTDEFENKFVGLHSEPWTAIHPDDGPATGGDKIQLLVTGHPRSWRREETYLWKNRRDEIPNEFEIAGETQALVSGVLYEKPTVPIAHTDHSSDWDIEEAIGGSWVDVGSDREALLCSGPKNYLVDPCNEAVFLQKVRVDTLSPDGEGSEAVDGGVVD